MAETALGNRGNRSSRPMRIKNFGSIWGLLYPSRERDGFGISESVLFFLLPVYVCTMRCHMRLLKSKHECTSLPRRKARAKDTPTNTLLSSSHSPPHQKVNNRSTCRCRRRCRRCSCHCRLPTRFYTHGRSHRLRSLRSEAPSPSVHPGSPQ